MTDSRHWLRAAWPAALGCVLLATEAAADEPKQPGPKAAAKPQVVNEVIRSRVVANDSPEQAERRKQLDEARRRLAEAANEVARLSAGVYGSEEHVRMLAHPFDDRKVMLGVLIGGDAGGRGVPIAGVTPGGPAEKAGLREDDVIVRIDDVLLAAAALDDALGKMTGHLAGLEPGAEVEVELLRGDERVTEKIELTPPDFTFRIGPFPGMPRMGPGVHALSGGPGVRTFLHREVFETQAFSDLELVPLTEGLGRYFGASEGLLVVRAPKDERIGLEDGDVILEIDGRRPKDAAHAVRILGSYGEGERLTVKIQRAKGARTLDVKLWK